MLPAARLGDMVACPITGVPTPIAVGVPTVLIGGMPAAFFGSTVPCVAPDSIVKGSATVLVGGMPAARSLDSAAHGGLVTVGCPTVLVGG